MKKITAIFALFLVALGGLTTVQAQEDPPEEPLDFQVSIDNDTPVQTIEDVPYSGGETNLSEDEDFYRLTIPDVVDFDDLDYLTTTYQTTDTQGDTTINYSSESDLDDYEHDYSSTMTAYVLYDLFDQDPLSPSDIMATTSDEENQGFEFFQNAFVGYFIEDDDENDSVKSLYVHEEMMNSYRTGDPDYDHELVTAAFEFSTTEYGDEIYFEAYSEGYDEGFDEGEQEGIEQGRDDHEVVDITWNDDNILRVEYGEGSSQLFSSELYNEAYQDGFDEGEESDFGQGWIMSLFGAFGQIFAIELLPGMTIGLLVGITLVPSVVLVFLKLFRG